MPVAAGIGAIGSIGSGLLGYFGSQNAASAQANAATNAANLQYQLGEQGLGILQKNFGTTQNALNPFINQGQTAGNTLLKLLTPGANQTATLSQIPGFQFAQDWGQKAVQNLGTTLGLGGNTLASGAQYATGLAQQGFGQITNALQGVLNAGTSAGSSLAGAATGTGSSAMFGLNQTGSSVGNSLTNVGNAQAAGILGGTNALAGGLSGVTNNVSNMIGLNSLLKAGGGAGIYGGNNLGPLSSIGTMNEGTFGGYADGGDPPVGQPSVVGERGPELFVPSQPGTILPANDPRTLAYLRSGALSRGPVLDALRAGGGLVAPNLTDYLANGPTTLTDQPYASGKLPSVDPRLTRAVQEGGNLAAVAPLAMGAPELAGAARLAPGVASRIAAGLPQYDLPATMSGVGPATIADFARGALNVGSAQAATKKLPPSVAGAAPMAGTQVASSGRDPTLPPPDPRYTADEQAQVDSITKQINMLQAQKAKATAGLGPKGAAVQGATYDGSIQRLNGQLDIIDGGANKRIAEQAPFNIRHPDLSTALDFAPALSPITGAAVGYGAGRTVTPIKRAIAYAAGAGGGALEGALGAAWPEKADLRMPEGSAARNAAIQNANDPYWWLGSGMETGIGAGLGALGAKLGMIRRWPAAPAAAALADAPRIPPSAPNAALEAPAAAPPPAQGALSSSSAGTRYGQPLKLTKYTDKNGQEFWADQFGYRAKRPANPRQP